MTARPAETDTSNRAWTRALESTAPIARNPTVTFPVRVQELAARFAENIALIGEDETLTYCALAERMNRYTRWALEHGLRRHDAVCLVMHNSPDYLAAWLGITRTGAIVSLVN